MSNFNPVFVNGTTIDDTWHQLLWELYHKGRKYLITNGSFAGSHRLAFDDVSGFIKNPHTRPLAPRMPEGSNLPAPTTDNEIDQYFANYLMNSDLAPHEDYKYATWIVGGEYVIPDDEKLLVDNFSLKGKYVDVPNQLQWVINHFKKAGFGNEHCCITIGYPESNMAYDIPFTNEMERRTSPCLRLLDFRIIEINGEHYLLLKVVYRSWDLYGGWPTNMGGFTLLNEYVAGELGINPGPLSFTCKSLHCYDFQLEVVKARLNK